MKKNRCYLLFRTPGILFKEKKTVLTIFINQLKSFLCFIDKSFNLAADIFFQTTADSFFVYFLCFQLIIFEHRSNFIQSVFFSFTWHGQIICSIARLQKF